MPGSRSRRLQVVAFIVSAGALVGIFLWARDQPAPDLPDDTTGWLQLALGLGLYALATVVRSERWYALLRHDGAEPVRKETYGLTTVGFAGNMVLPLRGGDALRLAYMAKHTGIRLRDSTGVLIAERGLDAGTLLLIYAVLAYGLLSGIDVPELSGFTTAGIAFLLLALLGLGTWALLRLSDLGRRARELAAPLLTASRDLLSAHGARMFALTFLIWSLEAGNLMLIADSVGLQMTALEGLYLVGLGGIFLLIPSGPGYAGTFDAAILFGAAAVGASSQLALSFLLMARLMIFIPITIVGAILMATRYRSGPPPPVRRMDIGDAKPGRTSGPPEVPSD